MRLRRRGRSFIDGLQQFYSKQHDICDNGCCNLDTVRVRAQVYVQDVLRIRLISLVRPRSCWRKTRYPLQPTVSHFISSHTSGQSGQ
jgi:hypothetical protein